MIQYHGSLQSRELSQAPMLLVFLTPRQALSSHPHQQMVRLYFPQDRDTVPNWYNINHPTTLHAHNEIQWLTVAYFITVSLIWNISLQNIDTFKLHSSQGSLKIMHGKAKLCLSSGRNLKIVLNPTSHDAIKISYAQPITGCTVWWCQILFKYLICQLFICYLGM